MGNETSANQTVRTTPYANSAEELFFQMFVVQDEKPFRSAIKYAVQSPHLMQILMTNPKILTKQEEAIQYLIDYSAGEEEQESFLKPYFHQLEISKTLMNIRLIDRNVKQLPIEQIDITNLISKSLLILFEYFFKTQTDPSIIQQVISDFNQLKPVSSMTLPLKQYLLTDNSFTGVLPIPTLVPHGMVSNGKFLFLLGSDSSIHIFPIVDTGSILPPITKTLVFQQNIASKLSYNSSGIICHCQKRFFFPFYQILSDEEEKYEAMDMKNEPIRDIQCICTDGAVLVTIDSSLIVSVTNIETGELIHQCKLCIGKEKLNIECPELMPESILVNAPVETNGSSLLFFIKISNERQFLTREFSLITGMHIHDEIIETEGAIVGATLDLIHNIHWLAVNIAGKVVIKAYQYYGTDDPFMYNLLLPPVVKEKKEHAAVLVLRDLIKILITNLGPNLYYKIDFSLDQYVPLLGQLCPIIESTTRMNNKYAQYIIEAFMLAIAKCTPVFMKEIACKKQLVFILTRLLQHSNPRFVDWGIFLVVQSFHSRTIPLDLLLQAVQKSNNALHSLFMSRLSYSNFFSLYETVGNELEKLIKQKGPYTIIHPHLFTMLLVQQRVIIREAIKELNEDAFASSKLLSHKFGRASPIDTLTEYMRIIVHQFTSDLFSYPTFPQLHESLIHHMFTNFLYLVWGVATNNTIAQFVLPLFAVLPMSMKSYFQDINMDPFSNDAAQRCFINVGFSFGIFAATLIQGGTSTVFEDKFYWLVKPNMDLCDHTDELNKILTSEITDDFVLNGEAKIKALHVFWRKFVHKSLSEDVLKLERIYIALLFKSMNIQEKFEASLKAKKLDPELIKPFDAMFNLRTTVVVMIRESKPIDKILEKGRILLSMKMEFSPEDDIPKLISAYLLSEEPADTVIHLIENQKIRLALTDTGFSLVRELYKQNIHPMFNQTVSSSLSTMGNFDSLAAILRFSQSSNHVFVSEFLNMVMSINNPHLLLIVHKMLHSHLISNEEIGKFLLPLFNDLMNQPFNTRLFGLCIHFVAYIPGAFQRLLDMLPNDENLLPLHLFLINDIIDTTKSCSVAVYKKLHQFALVCKSSLARNTILALASALKYVSIRRDQMKRDLTLLFEHIGKSLIEMSGLVLANEYVSFFREMMSEENSESSKIIKEILKSVNIEKSKDYQILAIFALLGGNIEVVRPYCTAQIRKSLDTYSNCITDGSKTEKVFFELPFNHDTTAIQVNNFLIQPVASVEFNPIFFPEYDFILSFYAKCTERMDSMMAAVYIQSLACYMAVKEFVKFFVSSPYFDDCITRLAYCMNPFDNIQYTINNLMDITTKPQVDPYGDFGRLYNENYKSYVLMSPILKKNSVAEVSVKSNGEFKGFIGIVEDTYTENYLYQIVHFPSNIVYPSKSSVRGSSPGNDFTFTVDEAKKTVNIGKVMIKLPKYCKNIRVVVSPDEGVVLDTVLMNNAAEVLDLTTPFKPEILGYNGDFENSRLYEFPEWLKMSVSEARDKLNTIPELPRFDFLLTNELDENHRSAPPPNNIPLHASECTSLSKVISDSAANHILAHLFTQWTSVLITRIVMNGYAANFPIARMMRLFSMLLTILEPLSLIDLHRGIFPFNMEVNILTPHAPVNKLNYGLSNNAIAALNEISKLDAFNQNLIKYTQSLVARKEAHLLTDPLIPVIYLPYGSVNMTTNIDGKSKKADKLVVAFPSFNRSKDINIRVSSNTVPFPLASEAGSITIDFLNQNDLQNSLCALCVSKWYTSWTFGTVYEALLLLRTLQMRKIDRVDPVFTRSMMIDLLLTQSPFAWMYSRKLLNYFSQNFLMQDNVTSDYLSRLLLLATFMVYFRNKVDVQVTSFFIQEQRAMTSNLPYILAPYFPEFLTMPVDVPTAPEVRIPLPNLDFSPSEKDIHSTNLLYQNLIIPRQTFEGFPFYEIIPLWLSLIDSEDEKPFEYSKVQITRIADCRLKFTNPNSAHCRMKFSYKQNALSSSYIEISSSQGMQRVEAKQMVSEVVVIDLVDKESIITLHGRDVVLDFNSEEIFIKLSSGGFNLEVDETMELVVVQPELFKEKFIDDMKKFIFKWTPALTRELVASFTGESFESKEFKPFYEEVKRSTLTMSYPLEVILLYALLIHRFNYMWINFKRFIPDSFVNTCMDFLATADTSKDFMTSVICSNAMLQSGPDLKIDRRSAQFLVLNGSGDQKKSIIAQFTKQISKLPTWRMQSRDRPWHVSFVGESAIDAGGPRKELFIELASSIFQPTSNLFILSPNGRDQVGNARDVYIPSTTLGKESHEQYRAVGTFLGVIVRNGLPQDIRFAPFIWKYLTGAIIGENDILMVDERTKTLFDRLRQSKSESDFTSRFEQKWNYISWTGEILPIPSQHYTEFVTGESVEQFIDEFVQCRINEVSVYLDLIREGFAVNIGFSTHPLMNATLISLLVQGSNIITTGQLKQITSFDGFKQEHQYVIENFWQAVDRMTSDQRSLLLKFATTLTRFPNRDLNPTFHITVKYNDGGDERLPHAQTCFCRLHLPKYSTPDIAFKKITLAIENCVTMENM